MEIVRIQDVDGRISYGAEEGNAVYRIDGDVFGDYQKTDEKLKPVRRLSPILPIAIYGIGLNYREHAEETGAEVPECPVVFCKGLGSVLDPDGVIELPRRLHSDQVDYEAELAVVIGKRCKNVSVEDALDYVLGYTCANDVSARDWQKRPGGGGQWTRGKSFDTFCPLGPSLVTIDQIPDPQILPIRSFVNGKIMQESFTGDMIFSIAEIISFLSGSTTLFSGTVILTGTPSGVGMASKPPKYLKSGDRVTVEITGIGCLDNRVEAEVY